MFSRAIQYATQALQEAAASLLVTVPPGRQQFHPSAAKVFARVTIAAGVPTLQESYNVTSITDDGVGLTTVTIATDFSTAGYIEIGVLLRDGAGAVCSQMSGIPAPTAGAFQHRVILTIDGSVSDSYQGFSVVCFGDQP